MSDPKPEKKPTIYEAIPLITGLVSPIVKGRENKAQGYKFRGIDDVYAVLNLLFAQYGVSALPEILSSNHEQAGSTKSGSSMWRHQVKVRYWLTDSYGARVGADAEGEGMDTGDKATGKAQSVAFKAMCFQVFCIPTGEKIEPNIDAEDDDPKVDAKPANGTARPVEKPVAKEDPSVKLCLGIKERIVKCSSVSDMVKLDTEVAELHKARSVNDAQKKRLGEIVTARLAELRLLQEQAA